MTSPIVIITAVESGLGFLLSSVILYLVLSNGRKAYHYFFAAFLLICTIWDLGTFLLMVRNTHVEELARIGYFIALPCGFIPILLFHFSNLYSGRLIKWALILGWVITFAMVGLGIAKLYWNITGIYTYPWGNIFKVTPGVFDPLGMITWLIFCVSSCWLVYQASKKTTSRLERRHYIYVTTGLIVITLAIVKVGVVMGINIPILLPMGMFFIDIFNAIIGIAIIKDKLFDITVVIKKGTLYSILAGILIFVYSFVEHILVTYVGERVGENSTVLHLISIAIGIAVLMPIKNRIEKSIEKYFAHRQVEF
jgi:hypothetical protein